MRRKEEVRIAYILSNAKVITRLCESKGEMCAEDNWYTHWAATSLRRDDKRLTLPLLPRIRTAGNPKVTSKLHNWT